MTKLFGAYRERRYPLAYWIIGLFTLAIEVMLGINAAFLVDQVCQVMTTNMLKGTQWSGLSFLIALLIGLGFGVCLCLGGLWSFSGFVDNLEDARAYVEDSGASGFAMWALWGLAILIMGLDFFTLAFRMDYFNEHSAGPLFWFFMILIPMPLLLGYLMYVLSNVPRHRHEAKALAKAVRLNTADMQHAVDEMDPDLRDRYARGDESAMQDHYDRLAAQRREQEEYEREKIKVREDKKAEQQAKQQKKRFPFQVVGPKQASGTDQSA